MSSGAVDPAIIAIDKALQGAERLIEDLSPGSPGYQELMDALDSMARSHPLGERAKSALERIILRLQS